MQYFGSSPGKIRLLLMLLPSCWRGQTTLDCDMLSSPDTLRVLLAGIAFMGWSTALESTLLGLPDIVTILKVINHTGLWDVDLSRYSPSSTCWNCLFDLEHSLGIHAFRPYLTLPWGSHNPSKNSWTIWLLYYD